MSFWCFLQDRKGVCKSSRPNFSFLREVAFWVVFSTIHCLFSKVGACPTLWLACEFWQLTFTLQSEEKMDDVLKSGHFSILTISICAVFVQNVRHSLQAALVVSEVLRTKVGFIHTTT